MDYLRIMTLSKNSGILKGIFGDLERLWWFSGVPQAQLNCRHGKWWWIILMNDDMTFMNCFQNAAEAFGKGARPNPNPLQPAQRESKKAPGGKGPVAQWLERRSSRLKIVSSNCGGGLFCATSTGVCQYGQYVVFLVSFRLPFTITSRRKFPVLCAKKIGAWKIVFLQSPISSHKAIRSHSTKRNRKGQLQPSSSHPTKRTKLHV